MKYTGGDINRLGEKLRKGPETKITDDDLNLLQAHRLSFTTPLFKTFKELTAIKSKVQRTAIIAFRLKRISTIMDKVIRKPKMELNRMWDIAGIRIIFDDERQLRRVLNEIQNLYKVRGKIRDYFDDPKKIGYRAVHIYITEPDSKKVIEVQLRTRESHNWATLVEITDVLFKTRLKEKGYDSHPDWGRFHHLVSSEKELNNEEANFLYRILDEYDFISKLADTFRKNSHTVKRQWQEVGHKDKFFLIESSATSSPILKGYRIYEEAERDYFQKYKEDENTLIVLTSIHKPSFDQISIAYANYILSYHKFISDVQNIIEELAIENLENNNFKAFRKIFRTYEVLQANNVINIIIERDDVAFERVGDQINLISKSKISSKKRKEIEKNINSQVGKLASKHKKFIDQIGNILSDKRLNKWRTRKFMQKHENRVDKTLKTINLQFEK